MLLEEGRSSKFVIAEAVLKSGVTLGAILVDELKETSAALKVTIWPVFKLIRRIHHPSPAFSQSHSAIIIIIIIMLSLGEDYAPTDLRWIP